jgi:hypothetical protein
MSFPRFTKCMKSLHGFHPKGPPNKAVGLICSIQISVWNVFGHHSWTEREGMMGEARAPWMVRVQSRSIASTKGRL